MKTNREKKDCRLHIFITDTTTSISLEPLTDDEPRWLRCTDGNGFFCSECGWWTELINPYCGVCGEKLQHPRLEIEKEKR